MSGVVVDVQTAVCVPVPHSQEERLIKDMTGVCDEEAAREGIGDHGISIRWRDGSIIGMSCLINGQPMIALITADCLLNDAEDAGK